MKLHNRVSDPFLITRGVKQGSVLSPSLFLVVMNTLIQKLRSISCGASLQGIYTGTAIHADDVRCIAPNVQSLLTQSSEIQSRISQIPSKESTQVKIGKDVIAPSRSARCLGVQWQHNLSASESVKVNISKARKAFFSLGSTGVFHGKLNPLSASSIFETCIIPILLYGCETWLLDSTCLQDLEKFQCEIGRRILGLSKFHSNTVVRVALHWPSMSTRTLLRKLSFLGKLICNNADTMSSPIFTTICMDDIYSLPIVQQCRMLEAPLATDVVHQLLSDLPNAKSIIVKNKKLLLERDYDLLLVSAKAHPTAQYISQIASHTSWRKIWDNALDYGVKGTISCQALLHELS